MKIKIEIMGNPEKGKEYSDKFQNMLRQEKRKLKNEDEKIEYEIINITHQIRSAGYNKI